jgi:hypothetical protein
MADKKISALTASTTPLAGTEVLPIVQGGATVKVAVSNLTTGRAFSALSSTFSGQTLTAATDTPIMDLSATWNTSGTPNAIKLNVTDTASNASSLLLNLQVGGTLRASVDKNGNLSASGTITSNPGGSYSRVLDNTGLRIVTPANATGQVRFLQTGIQDWIISNVATSGNLSLGGVIIITPSNNVGIGTSSPAATAILDVQSTTKGVRFPNMTTAQKTAITPSVGTVVFDTTLAKLCVYAAGAWQTITSV